MNQEIKEIKEKSSLKEDSEKNSEQLFDFVPEIKDLSNEGKSKVSVTISDLPHTLGTTVGNCLRRIIYQFGRAGEVIAFTISNGSFSSKSEFGSVPGVSESVLEITSRLRRIIFSSKKEKEIDYFITSSEKFKASVEVVNNSEHQLVVTGNDLKVEDENFFVHNKDIKILTLSPQSKIKLEIFCIFSSKIIEEKKLFDKNLVEEDQWISSETEIIRIGGKSPNYNPIVNISFNVTEEVVDINRESDKLVFEVETNGSIHPKTAILRGISICKQIFEKISTGLLNHKKK